jgi:TonB-dependent receptor
MQVLSSVGKIFIAGLFVPFIAFGQATLRGSVTDSANNESLIGASVLIQGTSLGAATDIDGKFRISGIPERVFSVKASYVGYEPKIIEIDLSVTKDVYIDIQLKPTVIKGEEVIVTAQMRGQLAAINQQITSKTIMNVVSEEKIQELPDANAAEAIGRLPGVSIIRTGGEATNIVLRGLSSKFSNITVDGVKVPPTDPNTRDVDLSMMSQGALAGIELYKTLTPDQDADAIAGTVNLVTRKAPSERLIRFDIKGVYSGLMKTANQYDFSGRYGKRFFNDIIGLQIQANFEKKNRSSEKDSIRYLYKPESALYFNDYRVNRLQVGFIDQTRKRNGGQLIIDINTPDSGSVKLSGLYSSTETNIGSYSRNYALNTGGGTWDYNFRYQEFGINTANASLQGKNHIFGLDVDWNMSYAQSKGTNPYDFLMVFQEANGGGTSIPEARDHPENLTKYAVNNYSAAQCSSSVFNKQENYDKEVTTYLNLSKRYTLGNLLSGELKGGGKYKSRSRWMDQEQFGDNNQLHGLYLGGVDTAAFKASRFGAYYARGAGTAVLSDFVDEPAPTRDLLGKYRMNPIINLDAIRQFYGFMKNAYFGGNSEFSRSSLADINGYTTSEKLSSAFIMNTLDIGQSITLITGLRVEQEDNDYLAHYGVGLNVIGIIVSGPINDTTARYKETIWLPNVQLVIRPKDFLTIRLAGYRALARPDYNMRLPRFSTINGTPTPFTLGNTNLRNTKAWNFEVNAQVFNNTVGLISVSAFYKKIDDLYHSMTTLPIGGTGDSRYNDSVLSSIGITWQKSGVFKTIMDYNSNATYSLPYNSPGPSYAWGFEIEHQMNFSFLSVSWLKNITLSYNLSITRSETQIIISDQYQPYFLIFNGSRWVWNAGTQYNLAKRVTRQSENQPNIYGNCSLGYDIGSFSARISVFYQDESIRSYSATGQADVHINSFSKWDLALKKQITRIVTLFLNIDNLTNQVETASQVNTLRDWKLLNDEASYGISVDFGIRLSL